MQPQLTDVSLVMVGGVKATQQYFSAVTSESPEFVGDPADGILGLAFPAISNLGQVRNTLTPCILVPSDRILRS